MSRSISLDYEDAVSGDRVPIEIPGSHDVLGSQRSSMVFWSIPRLKEIGIERLTILGETDPVYFHGWEDLDLLEREIGLLRDHVTEIDFHEPTKAEYLENLTYCLNLLRETAPKDSIPVFGIG